MPDVGEEGGAGAGEGGGPLEFLRTHPQFQALRSMVRVNPQILQPMLQELSKQNPNLMRTIRNNQQEFIRLINEGGEGEGEGDAMALDITAEENEAVLRVRGNGGSCEDASDRVLTRGVRILEFSYDVSAGGFGVHTARGCGGVPGVRQERATGSELFARDSRIRRLRSRWGGQV